MEAEVEVVVLEHSICFVATQGRGRTRWKNGGEFEGFQLGANTLDFFNKKVDLGENLGLVINLRSVSIHPFTIGTRQE